MDTKTKLTWNKYIKALDKIVEKFKGQRFDVIIGLTRGGLIPGVYLSHKLEKPLLPFNPHLLHADGEPRSDRIKLPISPVTVRTVLLVDDISDTGTTFKKCCNFFTKRGFKCLTTSVYINKKTSNFEPDFVIYNSHKKWIVFPYETEQSSE